MPSTFSSSKLLSVIVAGGTGSTGREVVSKLVAHPKVGRVVVLSRYAIPVNRWQTFFPNIRTSDALRHLSIVDVNWERLYHDTLPIGLDMLVNGGDAEKKQPSDPLPACGSRGGHKTASSASVRVTECSSKIGVVSDFDGNPVDDWELVDQAVPTDSALQRSRYMRFQRDVQSSAGDSQSPRVEPRDAPGLPVSGRRAARRKLNALTKSSYYRSIFSGHHVAINCLGSHNLLNPWGVAAVDYNYAMAFAKLVRLFNCYVEDRDAESAVDEVEALAESARSIGYDSVLWREVCAAYLGPESVAVANAAYPPGKKFPPASSNDSDDPDGSTKEVTTYLAEFARYRKDLLSTSATQNASGPSGVSSSHQQQRRPTLLHYAQVSAAGASPLSPLPYFSAHGSCDEETTRLFSTLPQPPIQEEEGGLRGVDANGGTSSCSSALSSLSEMGSSFVNPLSLDIYKPALLKRPNPRWWERLLGMVAPPISVESLSSMIVEDVLLKSRAFWAPKATPDESTTTAPSTVGSANLLGRFDAATTELLERRRQMLSGNTSSAVTTTTRIVHAKEIAWRAQQYELKKAVPSASSSAPRSS